MTSQTETETPEREEFSFQAEINSLLKLLAHSLYQNKEIAIRELVSNASDALDKIRHLQLTDESVKSDDPLEIHLEPDAEAKILTIRDNGVGLSHDDLIQNLGTIAHSGSLEFLKQLSQESGTSNDLSLIGQFGVGFYSAFMLAEKVEILTRSYQGEECWRWMSDGSGSFSIEPTENLERGTQVRLHLKEGLEEFTEPLRLKTIIRKYSTFVPHPVMLDGEQLNEQRPIWVEPKSQLSEEQYQKFYEYLSHQIDEKPLWHLHISIDSPRQFHALIYCPATNYEALGFGRVEHGLHLCAKRILVQDDCDKLLPEYLRFLYGLVDSDDLPLNVSRETLQDDAVFTKIKRVLLKQIFKQLDSLAEDHDAYSQFYNQFGSILREGINDFEHRNSVAELLRFRSSVTGELKLTSLSDYLERASENQTQIYYACGTDLESIKKNPNLEIFHKKKLEVLYLDDPIDEFVLSNLHLFEEKQLVPIDSVDVQFPETSTSDADDDAESSSDSQEDASTEEGSDTELPGGFSVVLTLIKDALGDRVEDVKESKRLTESPCCLVQSSGGMSTQLQKILQMTNKEAEFGKRILEINPRHPLVQRLCKLSANSQNVEFIRHCGAQLYANALLMEGLPPDLDSMIDRTESFMKELAEKRTSIIT